MAPQNAPKWSKYLFVLAGFLLLLSVILFWKQSETLSFVPRKAPLLVSPFNDKGIGGQSETSLLEASANKIEFSYTLKEGYEYPYAGISIEDSNSTLFDLKKFEVLKISLVAKKGEKIPISFNAVHPDYTQANNPASLVPFEFEIVIKEGQQNYEIPLENFEVPQWWNKQHKVDSIIVFKSLMNQIQTVNIENCSVTPLNQKDQIKIFRLVAENDKSLTILFFWLGILTLTSALVVQKLNKRNHLEIIYTPTSAKNKNEAQQDLLGFIGQHYAEEGLSIASLKDNLGLTEHAITAYIKQESGMTFKQYLNSLRLTESKRLLQETKLSISEIAYQVGYSNVSHFNRVFKSSEGTAPSAFRNDNKA